MAVFSTRVTPQKVYLVIKVGCLGTAPLNASFCILSELSLEEEGGVLGENTHIFSNPKKKQKQKKSPERGLNSFLKS